MMATKGGASQNGQHGGRHLVAASYELFLGRELDDTRVAEERCGWPDSEILASVLGSDEFRGTVLRLLAGEPLPGHLFMSPISVRDRYWIVEMLTVDAATAEAVMQAHDRREILVALLGDARFMRAAGMSAIIDLPPLNRGQDDRDRAEHLTLLPEDAHRWRIEEDLFR